MDELCMVVCDMDVCGLDNQVRNGLTMMGSCARIFQKDAAVKKNNDKLIRKQIQNERDRMKLD